MLTERQGLCFAQLPTTIPLTALALNQDGLDMNAGLVPGQAGKTPEE